MPLYFYTAMFRATAKKYIIKITNNESGKRHDTLTKTSLHSPYITEIGLYTFFILVYLEKFPILLVQIYIS